MIGAMIPVARVSEHNATLDSQGFGPENFIVPVWNVSNQHTHTALMYTGFRNDFINAVKALLGVQTIEVDGEPKDLMDALTGGRDNWGFREAAQSNGYPAWVQPTNAGNAYKIGDIVSHNGQNWICTVQNNFAEPGTTGWEIAV